MGALHGTADTAKTLSSVFFGSVMAWVFAYFTSERAYPRQASASKIGRCITHVIARFRVHRFLISL